MPGDGPISEDEAEAMAADVGFEDEPNEPADDDAEDEGAGE